MESSKIAILILGMTVVTYFPRALPAILVQKMNFGAKMEQFLKLIPYTAMAALIFPGVLWVDANNPYIGVVGGAIAAIFAWRKQSIMICVLAAIATDLVMYLIM